MPGNFLKILFGFLFSMAPPPAIIWKFYNSEKKCNVCGKSENNSKNAKNHLRDNHPEEFKKFEDEITTMNSTENEDDSFERHQNELQKIRAFDES